jgi:transposase
VLVELAREKAAPVAQIAKDLGISESCLRNWMAHADIEEGKKEGLTSSERKELAQLRRDKRRLETENEILRRAAAFSAREISPKWASGWSVTLPPTACPSRWPAGCWAFRPRGL